MNKYIKTNSSIIYNKLIKISEISKKINKNLKCNKCNNHDNNNDILEYEYEFKNNSKNIINFSDIDLHLLKEHNIILIDLYENICNYKIDFMYNFGLFSTNTIYIIDGVYEEGSKQKYIEEKHNINNSKITRFSEHFGFITFNKNKIDTITFLNDYRVDKEDPLIYQPKNCIQSLSVDYIFHTHPQTPYIGSRIKNGIIYEFPSISDIIHFIDHHNNGKLLGSLVMTPEGLYIIHKFYFNREKIKIDTDILIDELYEIYSECYKNSNSNYKSLNLKKMLKKGFVKIPDNIFFTKIANNFEFINLINKILIKFDIYIDFYPRTKLLNYWVIPDIYLPIL